MEAVAKFPKIETLYVRDKMTFKAIPTQLRCPEFALVKQWLMTEKIDGRNHRVILFPDGHIEHRGRTDKTQMPKCLSPIHKMFSETKLDTVFKHKDGVWPFVCLYGEAYGPKIQSGGKYRDDVSFRLFDIKVGDRWLNWFNVEEIAERLNIETVPFLGYHQDRLPTCSAELADLFDVEGESLTAWTDSENRIQAKGVVARTNPLLFNRRGNRIMWKLKFKDFS